MIVEKDDFTPPVNGFSVSNPITLASGEEVSFDWFAQSPLTVGIVEIQSLDFNATTDLPNLSVMSSSQSGNIKAVVRDTSAVVLIVAASSLSGFVGKVQIRRTPFVWIGYLLALFSLTLLLVVTVSHATHLRRQERDRAL